MNLLYPKISLRLIPAMAGVMVVGAMIAGVYGMLHDQITFTIAPEYFTRLKFRQFAYANLGWPARVFVAEIGFLATWWVGLIAGWFLARLAMPRWPVAEALRRCLAGFGVIFLFAVLAGLTGSLLGIWHTADYSYWEGMCAELEVKDVPAFVRVAYIHNASYLGGLFGMGVALGGLFLAGKRWKNGQR